MSFKREFVVLLQERLKQAVWTDAFDKVPILQVGCNSPVGAMEQANVCYCKETIPKMVGKSRLWFVLFGFLELINGLKTGIKVAVIMYVIFENFK